MGMKKREAMVTAFKDAGIITAEQAASILPEVPPVPSLPKTSVAPKSDPNGVSPVAPTKFGMSPAISAPYGNSGDKGLGKVLATEPVLRPKGLSDYAKPWLPEEIERNDKRDILTHVLLSPTLANLAIGKNDDEVLTLTRKFFKYQLETNQLAKRGEL